MGRPIMYPDRISTNLRLERDLHDELHKAAVERDVSVNYIVVRAIREWLDAHSEDAS